MQPYFFIRNNRLLEKIEYLSILFIEEKKLYQDRHHDKKLYRPGDDEEF
jgi:hypothetical protein